MCIPFLDLKSQYRGIQDEINQKVLEVISSQRFILGEEVKSFEKEIADYIGSRHAVGVSSGTDALMISLMALGVGEGDYVVTTPFTFFSTASTIVRLKATPVFCDIEEKSFNLSPEKLEEILRKKIAWRNESRIKLIVPVHLYGQVADMEPILELAQTFSLFVLEDGAQAIGAEYPTDEGSKKACTLGNAGILSFYPSKNLGACGDGGMVLTDDENLAERMMLLRVHGSKNAYLHEELGGNFRLDELQAAILRVKLKYLDQWLKERRKKALQYHRLLSESGLVDAGQVRIPLELYRNKGIENYHTYHQYVIKVHNRDKLQVFLQEKGIPTAVYYPLGLHLQKCFAYLGYKKGDFSVTEKVSSEVLALPIYPELPEEHQDHIVSSMKEFYSKNP